MRTDYQFLIGRDFFVGDEIYTVRAVAWMEDYAVVEASPSDRADEDTPPIHSFPVNQVLHWLLVEEEIELFNPSFLGLAGS